MRQRTGGFVSQAVGALRRGFLARGLSEAEVPLQPLTRQSPAIRDMLLSDQHPAEAEQQTGQQN